MRPVAEVARDRADALARLLGDVDLHRRVVEDPRDGALGDAGGGGDVLHRDRLPALARGPRWGLSGQRDVSCARESSPQRGARSLAPTLRGEQIEREAVQDAELWFVAGSQHLYGDDVLARVAEQSGEIAAGLAESLPLALVHKPVVTGPDAIRRLCLEANASDACVGIVAWMHTFSPAKMWIAGLEALGSRSCTCTRSSTQRCRGRRSTWTS